MASWFLKYMIVTDLQTRKRYYFIADQWLAVEEDDGMVSDHQSKNPIFHQIGCASLSPKMIFLFIVFMLFICQPIYTAYSADYILSFQMHHESQIF